jgi:outer membrane protein assembly factor BamB
MTHTLAVLHVKVQQRARKARTYRLANWTLLWTICLLVPAVAQAQMMLCAYGTVSKTGWSCKSSSEFSTPFVYAGPPGSTVYAIAQFGPNSLIDVYFDTKEISLAVTNSGGWVAAPVEVPADAPEGGHWITISEDGGSAGQSPFQVTGNWSAFRYSATHKSNNPYENILSDKNVGAIDIAWSYLTGDMVYSSPAQLDTVTSMRGLYGTASFDTYFGSLDGNVYDVDGVAGTEKWNFPTSGIVTSSPVVNGGTVYVGSSDGNLYSLNASTGALNWNFLSNNSVFSSPAIADGNVYFGSNDFNIYAVNASSGALVWQFFTGNAVGTSPAISNRLLYAGSDNATLYALDAATGGQAWSVNLTASCTVATLSGPGTKGNPGSKLVGSAFLSSAAVYDGVVYIGYNNGVYAFNGLTGAQIWSTGQLSDQSCNVPSSPAVANGVVYVGAGDSNVYALNAKTGAIVWSYTTGGPVDSSPAVANGVVYIGSSDGNVYALKASTGAYLWSFATGGNVESSPTIANGTLYVGSDDANMYAFNLAGGQQVRANVHRPDPAKLHRDPNMKVIPTSVDPARRQTTSGGDL